MHLEYYAIESSHPTKDLDSLTVNTLTALLLERLNKSILLCL